MIWKYGQIRLFCSLCPDWQPPDLKSFMQVARRQSITKGHD